jgi:C-terminal processing protease CtpA/Prc
MSPSPKKRTEILTRIKMRVLKHHFNVAGIDHNTWVKRVDERTPALLNVPLGDFENGVRELIAQLGSSHTVFYHERTNRLLPQHCINATLRCFNIDGADRWVFLDVFEGGPADKAGIKASNVLVAVDGGPCAPPTMPPFQLGQTYGLTISTVRGANTRTVAVSIPVRKGTKSRPPIIEPKSPIHRMIAANVGLLKVPYFSDPTGLGFARALDVAVEELKRHGCDRLIVDLRGNIGGSLGFARLASYFCPGQIPIGRSLTPSRLRSGYNRDTLPHVRMPATRPELFLALARYAFRDKSVVLLTQGLGTQPFHGSIVLLVNQWTNSAAEMLASFAAENHLATIVGAQTAGNVLGAVNFAVGSSYWLRLPVFGWYTSEGLCLEGRGVSPHVLVDVDPTIAQEGADRQMDRALEILSGGNTLWRAGHA